MASTSKLKSVKKTKEADFNSKIDIDNTAPLNQIVEDLHSREQHSRAYRLYHQLLAHRRNSKSYSRISYHCTLPGHPLNAFTENFDGDIDPNYFEKFLYKSLMPKMITEMRNIGKSDPVTKIMKEKSHWRNKMYKIKNVHLTRYPHKNKLESCNDEVMCCPKYMIELAEILENDPDPNFSDCYNWYYAGGGNLQRVCVNWIDYLVHSEFSCVYLTRFTKESLTINFQDTTCFNCGEGNDILETICSSQNIVALRTKHKVFILKIEEQDYKVIFKEHKSFENEIPFTSISFDKHHKNILYATTLDCKLKIVNIDRITARTLILKQKPSLEDNWNSVIGSTRGMFMHIQKDSITAYDKRTNTVVNSWSGVKGVVDEVDCNAISAAVQPEGSDGLYFTTQHHLFLMDTRCSRTTKTKVIQRWTHGMQCIPSYITIQKAEFNKELIFLSSQWCEDLCVVSNYSDKLTKHSDIDGVSIPYRPPSIFNVLHEARQKQLCWDLHNPIISRLTMSITGKVEVEQGNKMIILMHNSMGDISSHILYPSYLETLMEDNALQELHNWSKNYKEENKIFEVSSVQDIRGLWKKLKRIPDDCIDLVIESDQAKIIDEKQVYEAFEKEELMPELLDVWKNDQSEEMVEEQTFNDINLQYIASDSE
ncbi:uncharacterized protein ACR2FA_005488 [Aphomia sociella]